MMLVVNENKIKKRFYHWKDEKHQIEERETGQIGQSLYIFKIECDNYNETFDG